MTRRVKLPRFANSSKLQEAILADVAETDPAPPLKQWARTMKCDVHALYLAARDPRVPWYAKAVAIGVAAYALSPIDLIPDFLPVIGYLDDLVIVPAGILLAVWLIPADLMREFRTAAASGAQERTLGRLGPAVIVFLWIASAVTAAILLWRAMSRR
jgi:uncharacterized membrane protein YkvA (DUF1232 family)